MGRISIDTSLLTFVNVFSCEPADQEKLVCTLQRETEEAIRHIPGFVSANIHRSLDGCRVANYAQWVSVEAFHDFLESESGTQMMQRVHRYASALDIRLYEVCSAYAGPSPNGSDA